MSSEWSKMPDPIITVTRNNHGDFVLQTGVAGQFVTESKATALEVLNEWFDYHTKMLIRNEIISENPKTVDAE